MKKISILLFGLGFVTSFAQLTTATVESYSNISAQPTKVLEACEDGSFYGTPKYYVGDFSTRYIANQFTVPSGTTFSPTQLEMYFALPTDATLVDCEIQIFTDADGLPGELIFTEMVEPSTTEFMQDITFTGGETASEYTVYFDLSAASFPVLSAPSGDTKFWVATKPNPSATPVRHEAQDLTRDIGTMLLRDSGWGFLAVTTEPNVPLEIPFFMRGECAPLSTSDANATALTIYPNPVKDQLNINLKNAEVKSVSVTDLSGKTVANFASAKSIHVGNLPAGVYVVKVIDTKGNVTTTKVVKK